MDYSDGQQVERVRDAGLESIGPYTLIAQIAGGDFTSVHLAQKQGALGFHRLAAIKRLKPELAKQPEWTQLLLDEARLSAAVRHPNIVDIIDVGTDGGVYIVMDYIEGADLDILIERAGKERHPRYLVPPIVDALTGLHAVHSAHDELGESLFMVHQAPRARHILIGIDGVSRITDFSQVSARGLIPSTLRGKRLAPGYMAPEQVLVSEPVSARTDVFIAGITLWETLTGTRLFHADTPPLSRRAITERHIPRPSEVGLQPPRCFDDICMKALQRNPDQRYQSALEMARELREVAQNEALYATASELGQWVRALASRALVERRRALGSDAPSTEIPLPVDPPAPYAGVQVSYAGVEPPISETLPAGHFGRGESHSVVPPAPYETHSPLASTPASQTLDEQGQVAPAAEPSRVSLSYTVPVTAPAASSRPPRASSKSTLMGVSPRPRSPSSMPPPALAATLGYGHVAAQRASQSQQPATIVVGHAEALARTPPPLAGRRPLGSMPANATLPEGSFIRDLQLPSALPPRGAYQRSPAVGIADALVSDSHEHPPLHAQASYAAPQPYAEQRSSYPAAQHYAAAQPSYTPPQQAYPAAHARDEVERERGSAPSGAFPTTFGESMGRHGEVRFPTSDGLVPADIFARVKAAQREAGESFRPSAYGTDSQWEDPPRRRSTFSSLLLVGVVLAAGVFGYRHYAGQFEPSNTPLDPPLNPASQDEQAGAPAVDHAAAAAPAAVLPAPAAPAEPGASAPGALPAEQVAPTPAVPPLEQAAAPSEVAPPVAPSEAVPPTRTPATRSDEGRAPGTPLRTGRPDARADQAGGASLARPRANTDARPSTEDRVALKRAMAPLSKPSASPKRGPAITRPTLDRVAPRLTPAQPDENLPDNPY